MPSKQNKTTRNRWKTLAKPVQPRPDREECSICMSEPKPRLGAIRSHLRPACGHVFCSACTQQYIEVTAQHHRRYIPCADPYCERHLSMTEIDHHCPQVASKLRARRLEEDERVVSAPQENRDCPRCSAPLEVVPVNRSSCWLVLRCANGTCAHGRASIPVALGRSFCLFCREEVRFSGLFHRCKASTAPGNAIPESETQHVGLATATNNNLVNFVAEESKRDPKSLGCCPTCLAVIQKSGGCNMMRCVCGTKFCWGCLSPMMEHDNRLCAWRSAALVPRWIRQVNCIKALTALMKISAVVSVVMMLWCVRNAMREGIPSIMLVVESLVVGIASVALFFLVRDQFARYLFRTRMCQEYGAMFLARRMLRTKGIVVVVGGDVSLRDWQDQGWIDCRELPRHCSRVVPVASATVDGEEIVVSFVCATHESKTVDLAAATRQKDIENVIRSKVVMVRQTALNALPYHKYRPIAALLGIKLK